MTHTHTLALVACSQTKAATAAPAELLYTSQLFRAAAGYARRVADSWLILSAKHGLVEPAELLEPYDQRLRGDRHARRAWAGRVQAGFARWCLDQADREGLRRFDTGRLRLLVLAGRDYVDSLPGWMRDRCEQPLAGLQIGERLRFLSQARQADLQPLLF